MKPKITAQPTPTYDGEELQEYHPPVLFPEIGKFRASPASQRLYVLEMIEHIAGVREGEGELVDPKLCVTDMLAQPSKIRNLCGRIIFGIDLNPGTMREERATKDLDPRVMGYPVSIKCITGRSGTIKFKRGVVDDPRGVGANKIVNAAGRAMGVSTDENPNSRQMKLVRKVDEVVDYNASEAVLGLKDAWICLSQSGEYCRRARGRTVKRYWKFQEVDEDGDRMIDYASKAETVTEKRGPGRPRKEK
jgi:hypothetical protein